MELGGGNVAEGGRQYLQGAGSQSGGSSAGASTTANTCNNLPLDNARPVAMETTPSPLPYWPPPASDSPLTNNSKDAGDDGPRKSPQFDHSFQSEAARGGSWPADKGPEGKSVEPAAPPPPPPPPPTYSRTHNLPPIAAITSTHNYRGVREAVQKAATTAEVKAPEAPRSEPQGEMKAKTADGPKEKSPEETLPEEEEREKEELKTEDRPKTAGPEYVFSVPTAVHPLGNAKTLPIPRAPTPFSVVVTAANSINTHQYHAQPEALTLNISATSGVSSGSPSPSNRVAPSPHYLGSSPGANRLPTPNAPSPSESPKVLSHTNAPSPSSTSRLHSSPHLNLSSPHLNLSSPHLNLASPHLNLSSPHLNLSSPHLNLSSPSTEVNSPTMRIPSSPHPAPPPPLPPTPNPAAPATNRYGSTLPYPSYPYVNTPRTNAKPVPVQNSAPVDSRKVLPTQSVTYPMRSNPNDTHSCRNPFELPAAKPYPQQTPPPPPVPIPQQQLLGQPPPQHQQHGQPPPQHQQHGQPPPQHQQHGQPPPQQQQQHGQPPPQQHQQAFQHYPQVKPPSNYYPYAKTGEKDYDAYRRVQQPQMGPKGMYPMDAPQYGHQAHHQQYQQAQHQPQQQPPSQPPQPLPPPPPQPQPQPPQHRSHTHQIQREYANCPKPDEVRTWGKSEASDINQKSSYLNAQNKSSGFSKINYVGSEYQRVPSGYQDVQKTVPGRTPNGGCIVPNVYSADKIQKAPSQTNSLSQRFPPVPQSNYDLNRQIYDRMNAGTHHQLHPQHHHQLQQQPQPQQQPQQQHHHHYQHQQQQQNPHHQQQQQHHQDQQQPQQRLDKPLPQISKPQVNKLHPYFRDYPAAEKEKPKMFQEYPPNPNSSRPYAQYNMQTEEPKPLETYPKRLANPSYSYGAGDTGLVHPVPEHQRQMSQSYGSAPGQQPQPVQEVPNVDYDKPRFMNPQTVQPVMKPRPASSAAMKPKRESPLDLSVKTVRQSADSTAKDDADMYGQNFRGFLGTDSRYQMSNGPTSAPKIDFTPNFAGFHTETQPRAEAASSVLPPVESFKKLTQKTNHMDGHPKPQAYPVNKMMDPAQAKYPAMDSYKMEAQKRASGDPVRSHSSQPKLPKIDAWRLAMDQQIEQRLNSARQTQQATSSVADSSKAMPASAPTATTTASSASNYSRHSGHIRHSGAYPRLPVQTSAAPYNPSSYLHQPQCQPATPQTPQDNVPHRDGVGHSPDPEQIIKQISKGVMPDHKLLQDKNVMSILRYSLEEKEAKLIQLREAARRKERMKDQEGAKKAYPNYEQMPRNFPQGKQSLPPFGAITVERTGAPSPFPGHKLNVPRPVDTGKIDIEPTQNYLSPAVKHEAEKSGIPSADPSPQDDAQGPPTDLDGLAAFLAARIRTKAELKQVGPSLDNLRALSCHQSPKAPGGVTSLSETPDRLQTPSQGIASSGCSTTGSPPKLTRESRLLPPFRRRLFSHNDDDNAGGSVSSGAHGDDQLVRSQVPPRDPTGIRSSSETSVFDFRESDSESEMPILERQTLEGMRRDRKTFGSKQNVSSTTTPDDHGDANRGVEPEKIAELDISEPDPFWNTAFDMFVEQLEKRPPKRSVRKKRPNCRLSFSSDAKDDGDKSCPKTPPADTADGIGRSAIKVEPKDEETVEETAIVSGAVEVKTEPGTHVEKHEKLSASRLRVYRNELLSLAEAAEATKAAPSEAKGEKHEKEAKSEEAEKDSDRADKTDGRKDGERPKKAKAKRAELRSVRITRATSFPKDDPGLPYDSDIDLRDLKSDSSSVGDDDDSISLSGMESESSDSESNDDSSNGNYSSDGDDDEDYGGGRLRKRMRMQTRMQTRTSRQLRTTGMRLRSKAVPLPKATLRKSVKRRKRKRKRKDEGEYYTSTKKKPTFGDGSHFRPGWEEECYKFKQQLRMPEKLISISRPPKRSSSSLPDLEPYRNSPSMSLDSSDVSLPRKSEKAESENDSDDADARRQKRKSNDASSQDSDTALTSLFNLRNGKKSQTSSILNLLVNKYGRLPGKRQTRSITERKSPRILPKGSDKPELLPTPSLGIGKENVLKDKRKGKDAAAKKKTEENDSVYLGYFRRKTVNNFKEAFKEKGGLLPDEFSPEILKSRTRMQMKVMKKRVTLVEVFGDERPASAPPLGHAEDAASDADKPAEKKKPTKAQPKRVASGVVTRGKGMLTRSGRPGLRSAAVLRSNKAVQISKRHLNSGRQQRSIDLLRIRAMANKKFGESAERSPDGPAPAIQNQKRLKLRSVRRKFRSGFDYIRKKKKLKKDGDSVDGSVKEKKITAPRPNSESIADVQSEIKNWVINKGLGETILHRAARLGYTDVAAYCLEKMECSPSPRDNAGYTPLHEACSRGHLDIAKLLLLYGASVSESAKGGIRPLHEAAENGFTEIVRLLLSYGADPLLETYTGHTALSLVADEEARRLIQHHLADVQGNVAPPWAFLGPSPLFDPTESGCDPLADPPSPEGSHSEFEVEASESMLPPLYRLADDYPDRDPWVLLRDLVAFTKTKSREALLKQLNATESSREMKFADFQEQAKCCNLFGGGERTMTKTSKVVLVPYDEKVRQLLSVERVLV